MAHRSAGNQYGTGQRGGPESVPSEDMLTYIEEMSSSLSYLAHTHHHDQLSAILRYAAEEAQALSAELPPQRKDRPQP